MLFLRGNYFCELKAMNQILVISLPNILKDERKQGYNRAGFDDAGAPCCCGTTKDFKPGVLLHPIGAEWWLVMRLESYTPAIFDDAMAEKLSRELFDKWVNEQLARKIATYQKPDLAPTIG